MSEVRILPEALEIARRAAMVNGSVSESWPKPESLGSDLPPVDSITPELLPESLRPLVCDTAERMQVPLDYPAAIIVLTLAGAVGRRAVIQPKMHDTGWVVTPNLWGGIVAPPGLLKSPVIAAVTRPLTQIQIEWHREYESQMSDYACAKEEYGLRRRAWEQQYVSAAKGRSSVAPQRPDEPTEPRLRRLITSDATVPKLHEIMRDNPAGVLVHRDELAGWLAQLDTAGREDERAFALTAWNGDTPHTIDRIGRGTVHVEACCMSLLGGIQPGRLRSYMVDALRDGPSNDGLIQRMQVLVWPDAPRDWQYVDRAPDAKAEERAARVMRRLVEMDASTPARYRFDAAAQELFIAWLSDLEWTLRTGDLHSALAAHMAKYRSLMPSLALHLHLADWAAGATDAENRLLAAHTAGGSMVRLFGVSRAAALFMCSVPADAGRA